MKSLITGGAGFIGSHLAVALLQKGHEVIILDDLSGGFRRNLPGDAIFYECDITNKRLVDEIFKVEQPDYVFHLAAWACEGASHFMRNFNYTNNLVGSANLINASINNKVKKFIFTSSMSVYGSNNPPFTEDMILMPEDPYAVSKYGVEKDLKAAKELFGLDYVIYRPHNVRGPKQNIGDSYRNVIGIFINQCLRGEPMTVFGDGEQTRAFSHISDIVPYIAEAVDREDLNGETFNIGGDKVYTINEVANIIKSYFPGSSIVHEPPRYEVKHAYSSHGKTNERFKRRKPSTIEGRIEEMIKWAKDIGPQEPSRIGKTEIAYNLPPKRKKLLDA